MMSRRWAVIATVAAGLAACGSADDSDVVVSAEPVPTTTIDLADGAFIRHDGVTIEADGVAVSAEETTADTGTPTTVTAGGATGTTTGDASDGVTDGGTPNNGGGTQTAAVIDPGQGLIVISGVSYPFDIAFCEIESDVIEIGGAGTANDGAEFEASIFYDLADTDGDGTLDSVLEVSVEPDVPSGADGDSVPAFSAVGITTSSSGSDSDLTFEIAGSRISGSGTIVDVNGVAFPADRPGPMTFDARCA